MVNENSHIFVAHEVLKRIRSDEIRSIIEKHIDEFNLGAVILDSFFFDKRFQSISYNLHGAKGEPTSEIIFEMMKDYIKEGDNKGAAFIFGYLTHMAADISFHPMVFYKAGNYNSKDPMIKKNVAKFHLKIEGYIDESFNKTYEVSKDINPNIIKGMTFTKVFANYFGKRALKMKAITLNCVRKQIFFSSLFKNRFVYEVVKFLTRINFLKRGEVGLFYFDIDQDFLKKPIIYKHPVTGKKYTKRLTELFKESEDLGIKMINTANKFMKDGISEKKCREVIDGKSLSTGIVGKGIDSMKFYARRSGV